MIIEGYITIDNEYDNMPRINNEPICSYLEKLIANERSHKGIDTGYVKWKDKGLGEKHYYNLVRKAHSFRGGMDIT